MNHTTAFGGEDRWRLARKLFEEDRAAAHELAQLMQIDKGEMLDRAQREAWLVCSDTAKGDRPDAAGASALLRRGSARLKADLEAIISDRTDGAVSGEGLTKRLVELSKGIQNLEEVADRMEIAANEKERAPGDLVEFRARLEKQLAALVEDGEPE